ncbi:MAG: hypothetical protein QXS68_06515 [Candidatus Methanomethylicaceae archaeon]
MGVWSLTRDSPFRPPDWRWERARLTRADSQLRSRLRSTEDNWIEQARRFQREHERCTDHYRLLRLQEKQPVLFAAWDIHFHERQLLKWELQARLLSRDSCASIARRMSLTPEVIDTYEKLFFNVLDRLDQPSYIVQQVFGESLHAGLRERDFDLLWKLYGYIGGPWVLDAVVHKHLWIEVPQQASQVEDFLAKDVKNNVLLKTALATRTLGVHPETQQAVLAAYQKFMELQVKAESLGTQVSSGSTVAEGLQAILENTPWVVGRKKQMVSPKDATQVLGNLPEDLAQADELAAELRAEDLTRLALGESVEIPQPQVEERFHVSQVDQGNGAEDPTRPRRSDG